MGKDIEKKKIKKSKWRFIDMIIPVLIILGVMFYGMYHYYAIMFLVSFAVLIILFCCGKLYDVTIERSKLAKRIIIFFRTICYTLGIITLIMPMTMTCSIKWYYPIQKAYYGTEQREESFLPDKIPEKADNYKVRFLRYAFPGATRIEMSFFTDKETIELYRQKAINAGATTKPTKDFVSARWCKEEVEENIASFDDAEIYYYPDGSEHFPKFYILDEETGYVKIYY